MKAKLDREMPLPGKGRKGGGGKWWWPGSIIVIISAGVWMFTNTATGDDQTIDNTEHTEFIPPVSANIAASPQTPGAENKKNTGETVGTISDDNQTSNSGNPLTPTSLKNKNNLFHVLSHKNTPVKKAAGTNDPKRDKHTTRPATLSVAKYNPQNTSLVTDHNMEAGNKLPAVAFITNDKINIAGAPFAAAAYTYNPVRIQNTGYSSRKNIIQPERGSEAAILTIPAYVSTLPDLSAKRKELLRAMKRRERKEEKELARSYRTHHSFWGETTDRWFAAGIAPYQNIAIASQQTYNYNSAAGKNILTDYIPSPYLQLHVTNRIYLLSEFQFNTPQATPSLLLSHKTFAVPAANTDYTENIYLRKLYYFNMPVSFYYSPVRNFYIGSGLQFSSFNSALADMEQRSANNTLLRSETIKLKDDSLSSKINGSEWRYLFDANYYHNRFMFGFRYNQALNNFIDLRINNILPPTQARNQAFQFYIRYNLVVSDRKK